MNFDTMNYRYYSNKQLSMFPNKEAFIESINKVLSGPVFEKNLIADNSLSSSAIIQIHPSYSCNYRCSYCYENERKQDYSRLTVDDIYSIDKFYLLYDQLFNTKTAIKQIVISGGEPFLPENRVFVEEALAHWDSNISIITNGVFLINYVPLLSSRKNLVLSVSLDGTESMHYKYRKTTNYASYSLTVNGIQEALAAGIRVVISSVFHPDLLEEYSSFFNYLESLGWLENPLVSMTLGLKVSGTGSGAIDIDYLYQSLEALAILKEKDPRINCFDISSLIPGCKSVSTALKNAGNGKYNPYRCYVLNSPSFSFFPNGKVSFCSTIDQEIGYVGQIRPSITIDKDKIEKLHFRTINNLVGCQSCNKRIFCKGNCPATSIASTNSFLGNVCTYWGNDYVLSKSLDFLKLES